MLHDCFGSPLKAREGMFIFLCAECGRPFAELDKLGLRVISKHGKNKDKNTISLKALKVLIKEVER